MVIWLLRQDEMCQQIILFRRTNSVRIMVFTNINNNDFIIVHFLNLHNFLQETECKMLLVESLK